MREAKAVMTYERDTRRYHRFAVHDKDGKITGTIYFAKSAGEVPQRLVLETARNDEDTVWLSPPLPSRGMAS